MCLDCRFPEKNSNNKETTLTNSQDYQMIMHVVHTAGTVAAYFSLKYLILFRRLSNPSLSLPLHWLALFCIRNWKHCCPGVILALSQMSMGMQWSKLREWQFLVCFLALLRGCSRSCVVLCWLNCVLTTSLTCKWSQHDAGRAGRGSALQLWAARAGLPCNITLFKWFLYPSACIWRGWNSHCLVFQELFPNFCF